MNQPSLSTPTSFHKVDKQELTELDAVFGR